ncbi:hypothetical protein O181_054162 [Austropuccinia psidii MF-1]|uniref:Uncharacterized protein n=1 Tax=Austropuccinia psidii MF-1 TaxID=1389203 RepID=A0A9Q3E6C2_9BASI|nr:hypothetical protein [Austropuccinia psidii MF-1]
MNDVKLQLARNPVKLMISRFAWRAVAWSPIALSHRREQHIAHALVQSSMTLTGLGGRRLKSTATGRDRPHHSSRSNARRLGGAHPSGIVPSDILDLNHKVS